MNNKLHQYQIFKEAGVTLSFSTASRNLFISQSAVSQAIRALEKDLDTTLFLRKSKGVELTSEGKILLQYVQHALELLTTAENKLTSMQDLKSGTLTISAGDTLCSHYLTPYLEQFHLRYPKITLRIINRTSLETVDLLKSGQIDLGFLNLPVQDASLSIKECRKVTDIFVGDARYLRDQPYTKEEIAALPLILLEKNSNSRFIVEQQFLKHGIVLKPQIETGAHELLLQFAKIHLGVSCVIKEFSDDYLTKKQLYELKLNDPLPQRAIGYAYLKRLTPSSATMRFIQMIEEEQLSSVSSVSS